MTHPGIEVISRLFNDDGRFPNNGNLPLIIIKAAVPEEMIRPEEFERIFSQNGWPAAWRNGLYDCHHYHSSAHEALGVYSGWVHGCFGGPAGETFEARAGDVIIIPAGVSHCNKGQSADFRVVGAYPTGQPWDMNYGNPDERPAADRRIEALSIPDSDPVFGPEGPVMTLWH